MPHLQRRGSISVNSAPAVANRSLSASAHSGSSTYAAPSQKNLCCCPCYNPSRKISLAFVSALLCAMFVMLASVDSFVTQNVFFTSEFDKQMKRRQEFFGPTVSTQFYDLATIPPSLLTSAESVVVLAAQSSNPPTDPDVATLAGASFFVQLLVTFFYFETITAVSAVFPSTGIVITYVPESLYVTITKPVTVNQTTTVFRKQKYYVDTKLSPTMPFGPVVEVADVMVSDPEVQLASSQIMSLSSMFTNVIGPSDGMSKWGSVRCTSWSGNKSAGDYVPIYRFVSVDGAPSFLLRAEYSVRYLNGAWGAPTESDPRQLVVDQDGVIIATNVPAWVGTKNCRELLQGDIGRVLTEFLQSQNENASGKTDSFYFTAQAIDEQVAVLNGSWYLLETAATPDTPWDDVTDSIWAFIGTMFASMLAAGLMYYCFSKAIFAPLVGLADSLEKTANKLQGLINGESTGVVVRDDEAASSSDGSESTSNRCCRDGDGFSLLPDFWGAKAAHCRIVQHIDEILSFVPRKFLHGGSRPAPLVDDVAAPAEQSPHPEHQVSDSFAPVMSPAGDHQPIELMQRNRNVPNDEIGQLLRCRMTALHFQVLHVGRYKWPEMHAILKIAVREMLDHGGVIEGVEFGSVSCSFNCHAPVSEHEQFAIRAALAIERDVARHFPNASIAVVADSDVAASVALGNDAVRVQAVLGPSIEFARKLSMLELPPGSATHVIATGSVVTNIRHRTSIWDCVRPKYGLIHLNDPMRPVYHTNGGKVVHLVAHGPKTDDMFGSNTFKLNCAFQDMLEGEYKSALGTLLSIRDDVELRASVERLISLCEQLSPIGPKAVRYVRNEALPWETWPSEKELRHSSMNLPHMPALVSNVLEADDGLSGRRCSTSGRSSGASHASDPPLICSLSHLEDSTNAEIN